MIAPLAAEEALVAAAAPFPLTPASGPEEESGLPRPDGSAEAIASFCEAKVLAIEDASCQTDGFC